MNQQEVQHLLWRSGFGSHSGNLNQYIGIPRKDIVDRLFSQHANLESLNIDTSEFDKFKDIYVLKDKSKQLEFRKLSRQKLKAYNAKWVSRLVNTDNFLREKMTLFWTNHFVCRDNNILYAMQYNNTLREHALGDFGDFVKAISKEAAMLKYLNNKQNRKKKPNENFARELMELFTLGEGNYTEEDIKESARAFTGYSHNFRGEFILRKRRHDYDFKSFFGHRGRYDGDDIIDIILQQKQCARFICTKVYKYFVNDTIDTEKIEELTNVFYNDYNIENLMRYLFMSNWFYDQKHIGSKIKSPIDFVVGMCRTVPVSFNKTKDLLKIQKLLGQVLLYPPNVAGWKGGKSWIDSNTMMLRLKLPSIILANAKISITEKGEFEDSFEAYNSKKKKNRLVSVTVDWNAFETQFKNTTFSELEHQLIISKISDGTTSYLKTLSKNSKRNYCVQLMSLPEYQMC